MQKEIEVKELFRRAGVTENVDSLITGRWYLRYFIEGTFTVTVEITAKNFAEEFVGLPIDLQEKLILLIMNRLENPGDSLTITNSAKGGERKSTRIVRLISEDDKIHSVNLLVAR